MRRKCGERDRGNSSLQRKRGVKKTSLLQGKVGVLRTSESRGSV